MPSDFAERVVAGACALSPYLGNRMLAATLLRRPVVVRELMPQDLKLEIDSLTPDQAIGAARFLAAVVGKAHGRQMTPPIASAGSPNSIAIAANPSTLPTGSGPASSNSSPSTRPHTSSTAAATLSPRNSLIYFLGVSGRSFCTAAIVTFSCLMSSRSRLNTLMYTFAIHTTANHAIT